MTSLQRLLSGSLMKAATDGFWPIADIAKTCHDVSVGHRICVGRRLRQYRAVAEFASGRGKP